MDMLSMLFISEGILTLRTWTVWARDSKIGILMWIVFFVFFAGSAAATVSAMKGLICMPCSFLNDICLTSSPVNKFPIPTRFDFVGCFLTGGNTSLSIVWTLLLAYDAWMVSWLGVRSIQICKLPCIAVCLRTPSTYIHRPSRRTERSYEKCVQRRDYILHLSPL
jgi:hypothetical protein